MSGLDHTDVLLQMLFLNFVSLPVKPDAVELCYGVQPHLSILRVHMLVGDA